VWVVWSDGDSFGWAQNRNAEAIGIFRYRYCAEQLQGYIEDQNNSISEEFLLETADGQIFLLENGIPWYGYFEYLEQVNITAVIVN
jgi:hypothetical protein